MHSSLLSFFPSLILLFTPLHSFLPSFLPSSPFILAHFPNTFPYFFLHPLHLLLLSSLFLFFPVSSLSSLPSFLLHLSSLPLFISTLILFILTSLLISPSSFLSLFHIFILTFLLIYSFYSHFPHYFSSLASLPASLPPLPLYEWWNEILTCLKVGSVLIIQ